MINGIFDEKLKKIHMIFFELLPFFKFLDPEILHLCYSGMRYRLETSCMDSSWKNSRHVFFLGGGGGGIISPCKITAL